MNYTELQTLCDRKKIQIKDVLSATGMTYVGLKSAMDNESLTYRKVIPLCKCIGIFPNQLFGFSPLEPTTFQTIYEQNGVFNSQLFQSDMETLKEQLAKKDEQIDRLLNLLK